MANRFVQFEPAPSRTRDPEPNAVSRAEPTFPVITWQGMAPRWFRASPVLAMAAILLGAALFLTAPVVGAQDRVAKLARQLANSEDFRVRTQAALALGASKSKRAVDPLCDALEDSNTTVRAASAAALGKLKKGGKDCLKARLSEETSSSVKSVIRKSLKKLKNIGSSGAVQVSKSSRYYVQLAELADKSGRRGGVEKIAMRVIKKRLGKRDELVFAPSDETKTQAKKVLSKHSKLTGFYIAPKVKKPKYSGGNLKIRVQLTVFTYPGKVLKGMIPKSLTQQDVDKPDRKAEDELIKLAFDKATKQFLDNISKFE